MYSDQHLLTANENWTRNPDLSLKEKGDHEPEKASNLVWQEHKEQKQEEMKHPKESQESQAIGG